MGILATQWGKIFLMAWPHHRAPLSCVPERSCRREIRARESRKTRTFTVACGIRTVRLQTLPVCPENIVQLLNNQSCPKSRFEKTKLELASPLIGTETPKKRRYPSFLEKTTRPISHDESVLSTRLLRTGYLIRTSNRVNFHNVLLSAGPKPWDTNRLRPIQCNTTFHRNNRFIRNEQTKCIFYHYFYYY